MKTDEVARVKTTHNENEVNEYLARGYTLIKVLSSRLKGIDGAEEVKPIFVLGLGKELQ